MSNENASITPLASGPGTAGDDTYDGGIDERSVSLLQGGGGSDTYLLGRESGDDIIDEATNNNNASNSADRDVVRLKGCSGLMRWERDSLY